MNVVPLEEIFEVIHGNILSLIYLDRCHENDLRKVSFVSIARENNGVAGYVEELSHVVPFDAGLITVVTGPTSFLESFVQPFPFYTSSEVLVLKPKTDLTIHQKLYYCWAIRKNQFKYNFQRRATRTLSRLLIPALSELPDLVMNLQSESIQNPEVRSHCATALDTKKWKPFKFGGMDGLFVLRKGYFDKKPEFTEGGTLPFVGTTMLNNGVVDYCSIQDVEMHDRRGNKNSNGIIHQKIFKGNCITLSRNDEFAFYQPETFTCTCRINVFYLRDWPLNVYIALFLCTLIQLEGYRSATGVKRLPFRMADSEIRLPADSDGNPDWNFMENYIRDLMKRSGLNNLDEPPSA